MTHRRFFGWLWVLVGSIFSGLRMISRIAIAACDEKLGEFADRVEYKES
jgi:hypothetical protein